MFLYMVNRLIYCFVAIQKKDTSRFPCLQVKSGIGFNLTGKEKRGLSFEKQQKKGAGT
jgi:hypothetical protein